MAHGHRWTLIDTRCDTADPVRRSVCRSVGRLYRSASHSVAYTGRYKPFGRLVLIGRFGRSVVRSFTRSVGYLGRRERVGEGDDGRRRRRRVRLPRVPQRLRVALRRVRLTREHAATTRPTVFSNPCHQSNEDKTRCRSHRGRQERGRKRGVGVRKKVQQTWR